MWPEGAVYSPWLEIDGSCVAQPVGKDCRARIAGRASHPIHAYRTGSGWVVQLGTEEQAVRGIHCVSQDVLVVFLRVVEGQVKNLARAAPPSTRIGRFLTISEDVALICSMAKSFLSRNDSSDTEVSIEPSFSPATCHTAVPH
jgi:hypothetical protein